MKKTSIQLSQKNKEALKELKLNPSMTFDEVITELINNRNEKEVKIVKIGASEKYIHKTVKSVGNAGGINLPISWVGKEVVVILKENLKK